MVWGGIRFFERKEIKDSISYLRLISNHQDDMAYEVYFATTYLPEKTDGKLHIAKRWDFDNMLDESIVDLLLSYVPHLLFNL